MVCIFIYICKCSTQNCKHFVWRKLSKTKLYFTARMLLTNSWRISSACNKILNKKRIRQLFKNKTGFYFWFGEHKSQEQTKAKSPQKSSVSSLWGTEEEIAASRYFSDLRVQYKGKKKQPYEPDITAVKPVLCAFTCSPSPLEDWLSSGHCASPLVHKGRWPSVLRCYRLCRRSLCVSHAWLKVILLAN